MAQLVILAVLLIFVGFIGFSIFRNRKSDGTANLEKTLSFDPTSDIEPIQSASTPSPDFTHKPCALAVTLRIVGVVNIFAAIILGLVLADDFGWVISIAVILSGCLGCLFCYAFAKCVEAADKYLNSH
ncbi:MAG: hypothetical protein O2U62_00165 [Candidatus Bathyarchaeota archaeon]|nr:hypothetical protein [Candidatus Bathyarchaeota archaeon]